MRQQWNAFLEYWYGPKCKYGVRQRKHGPFGVGCVGCLDEDIQRYWAEKRKEEELKRQERIAEYAEGFRRAFKEALGGIRPPSH